MIRTQLEDRGQEWGNCRRAAIYARSYDGDGAETYHHAVRGLVEARVPFLVGGAFALSHYTPIVRETKDLDLFVRPRDVELALAALQDVGFRTALPFPHWLGKAYWGRDLRRRHLQLGKRRGPWSTTSGSTTLGEADVLGLPLLLLPPAEEMIRVEGVVCERERFDGADVLHLLRDPGAVLSTGGGS